MNRPRLILWLGACALASLGPAIASAQTAAPATARSVRGSVEALNGNTLTVRTKDGTDSKVTLASGWSVRAVIPSSLAAIKPGTFIGTATVGPVSHMTAREVVVFPEAMRGTGEGSYPWDLTPGSTMTNATVNAEVSGTSGRQLTLTYKGGTRTVTVPPGVPIVTFRPGEKSMLVPGAPVFARGPVQPDGSITTSGVAVGLNGLAPPM